MILSAILSATSLGSDLATGEFFGPLDTAVLGHEQAHFQLASFVFPGETPMRMNAALRRSAAGEKPGVAWGALLDGAEQTDLALMRERELPVK